MQNSDQDGLSESLSRHRNAVEQFIESARMLSSAEAITPRATGKWTPLQEAKHLVLTYRGYATELRDGPAVTPQTFAARLPDFRTKVLPRILAGNWFPAGVVAPRRAQPDNLHRDLGGVLAELAAAAEGFDRAVVEIAGTDRDRFVRHPYFGALSLDELVLMLTEHAHHHRRYLPDQLC